MAVLVGVVGRAAWEDPIAVGVAGRGAEREVGVAARGKLNGGCAAAVGGRFNGGTAMGKRAAPQLAEN